MENAIHSGPDYPAPDIVVVGSANTDFVIQVRELPSPGETVLGGRFSTARGGKGANQAVAAARLSARVVFVTRLGTDHLGQEAIDAYVEERIDTTYIPRDPGVPSGVALILVNEKGENLIAVASGANANLSPQDVFKVSSPIEKARCMLLQLEVPMETVKVAVELAYHHGVRVLLNPAPAAPIPEEILQKVFVLTPNEGELKLLLGDQAPENIEQAALLLSRQTGIPYLVVTLGSRGALIVSDGKVNHIPAFHVKPVDTTACGDAFNGALAFQLSQGVELLDAVRYANAVGALTATKPGAQPSLPTGEQVETFLREQKTTGA